MKHEKLTIIMSQFLNAGAVQYDLGNIDINKAKVLYRYPLGAFQDAAPGDYSLAMVSNSLKLNITNATIQNDVEAFQIIYEGTFEASEYITVLPELSILVDKYNQLVQDVSELYTFTTKHSFVADEKGDTKILPAMQEETFWYKDKNGQINLKKLDYLKTQYEEYSIAVTQFLREHLDNEIYPELEANVNTMTSSVNATFAGIKIDFNDYAEIVKQSISRQGNDASTLATAQIEARGEAEFTKQSVNLYNYINQHKVIAVNVAKEEILTYAGTLPMEQITDQKLDALVATKKTDLDLYTSNKKVELDTHRGYKEQELNTHTFNKTVELDAYTANEKIKLNSHTEQKKTELTNKADTEILRIGGELDKQIAENELTKRQEDVEYRIGRLETFRKGETPSTKLKGILGVQDGSFGYWEVNREKPVNADIARNWEDNGVYADMDKPVILNQNTNQMNLNIEEEESTDEKAFNENKMVIKKVEGHIELTKFTYTPNEIEGVEVMDVDQEHRVHDWVYYSAEECLEKFEELWENSYVWEEVLLSDCRLKEVVINRKHNEIVLSKIVDKLAYVNEEGVEFFNPIWKSKYFPLYPLSVSDLMEQFEDFWELNPRQKFILERSDEGYEIAGQVLENGIDLGEGYENILSTFRNLTIHQITANNREVIDFNDYQKIKGSITTPTILNCISTPVVTAEKDQLWQIKTKVRNNCTFPINVTANTLNMTNTTIEPNATKEINRCFPAFTNSILYFQIRHVGANIGDNFDVDVWYDKQITKTSAPKPFIKNSRPDSKLALPQLASLGELQSLDTATGVAQHEQGTVIFKRPQFDPNMPDHNLVFGAHAHKVDGKWRLLCKAKEADAKFVGYNLIKCEDESDGSCVFYDVGRTSTANNIAGKITVDGEIYIGEGYENLKNNRTNGWQCTAVIEDGITTITATTNTNSYSLHKVGEVEPNTTYSVSWNVISGAGNFEIRTSIHSFVSDLIISTASIGEATVTTKDFTMQNPDGVYIKVLNGAEVSIRYNITKTSTPKPYTDSSVPNGALNIAKPWTSADYSLIFKGAKILSYSESVLKTLYQCENTKVAFGVNERGGIWDGSTRQHEILGKNVDSFFSNSIAKTNDGVTIKNVSLANKGINTINVITYAGGHRDRHVDFYKQILIYKGDLGQTKMEAELAKTIDLSSYHFQENSVINTYGIKGFEKMYIYDKLTEAEVLEEKAKDIFAPKQPTWDIPNYKGE